MTNNVNPQEIAKFARLAAEWWNPEGGLKTLHQINPLRLGYILEKTSLKDKRVIDVGCGGGILSESLAQQGALVTGIDLNPDALYVAAEHSKNANLNIEYLDIAAEVMAEERAESYDVVTCFELLEHVPDPAAIIKACYQLVRPGGYVFFSTLNRNMKSYLFAIVGAEYVLKMLPKNTHEFSQFIKPSELSGWMRQAGLEVKEFKGVAYNIFTQQFRLTDDLSVNYFCYAQRP